MKKRKSTINRKRISKHTLRFQKSLGPPVTVRSMASVGGHTRRKMAKGHRSNSIAMPRDVGLHNSILAGLVQFKQFAEKFLQRLSMQSRRAVKRAQQP